MCEENNHNYKDIITESSHEDDIQKTTKKDIILFCSKCGNFKNYKPNL